MWESSFLDTMKNMDFKDIIVAYYSSQTLEKELGANAKSIIPLFSVTFTVMITFSVITCIMKDWVRSKPWLGQIGVVSAGLAIVSSFGLMLHAGVPFIDIVASTPFLILAIGVDDMFIMIAAWRQTNPRDTVEKRMEETLSEAAVSITITTLTDGLSFGIGAITDFPSVRIFCLYTGVAVLFDFFFQITFFAASMVFIGRREAANRHCMVCTKVIPTDEAENRSKIFRIFCTGGTPSKKKECEDLNQHVMMEFFRDYYGPFLNKIPTKVSVILVYGSYLGIAIWGITGMKEGLKLKNLADDASYASSFYNLEDKYFKEFGPKISVILEGKLDYWDGTVQTELFHLIKSFEDERNIFDNYTTEFWLRDFLSFVEQYNLTVNETNFVNVLKREFLPRNEKFSLDIHMDNSTDNIVASRFLVQSVRTTTASKEKELVLLARHLADNAHVDLSVTVFHPAFVFYDQYVAIMPNTLQNIGIALGSMVVISLLLIPNPICSLWVALSVASIEAGVVGYMVWWDVNLDSVSMINLIMCIGFSVDFSAHIAYAYISANGCTEKKLSSSLFSLGFPILQGALSTILGVLALCASSVYIFRTFFKIMFMVILFGAFHGLVLLPVLLSIVMPGTKRAPNISQSNSKQKKEFQRSKGDFSPTLRKWMNEVSRPSLYGVTNGHSCETRNKSEPILGMNGAMPYTITLNVRSEQF
ncbi:patched domain-containing protein 3 [Lingula anatina]|uniref:Patched domain-containing protein 3 n=1 Tax=Lingula anatina TaxID=7574 RepID=A0A1S3IYW2_LINAN|nr:patched domain-containing protein 3 [Lingula anatina]XP_023931430.1 patched domain-containing protein 3 [Lingula anatina]XP_023931431.1 patched domain-containing protein 3 [Lingula anatina]|eukprot:XP_013403203.1 patched domain-containing protein 3 [Lingula anatina]